MALQSVLTHVRGHKADAQLRQAIDRIQTGSNSDRAQIAKHKLEGRVS